jgi:fatty acid-binding protein DegV
VTLAKTYEELGRQSDEELMALHDADSQHTQVGISYYLEELARRRAQRQGDAVEEMTATIVRLTKAIALLTGLATLVTLANLAILLWSPLT